VARRLGHLYSLAVEEAIHGAGVLIGHAPLVAPALASGALVAPFARHVAANRPLVAAMRGPVPAGSSLADLVGRLSGQGPAVSP
jgi:LysR family glycine cleavage system transcriptional activator